MLATLLLLFFSWHRFRKRSCHATREKYFEGEEFRLKVKRKDLDSYLLWLLSLYVSLCWNSRLTCKFLTKIFLDFVINTFCLPLTDLTLEHWLINVVIWPALIGNDGLGIPKFCWKDPEFCGFSLEAWTWKNVQIHDLPNEIVSSLLYRRTSSMNSLRTWRNWQSLEIQ